MARRSPLMNVMVSAVLKASRNLRRDFGEVEQLQVSRKGPADFVSQADKRTEKTLFEELSRARPDFGFLMEEHGEVKGKRDDVRFIIDPLDGTTNFLHGLPHFAISVAVEERGEIVAGVVYAPLNDELFWAEKGQGAYLNESRLRVSGRNKMEDALLATGIPFKAVAIMSFSWLKWLSSCRTWQAFAALVPQPSTSHTWLPAAMTLSGNRALRHGISLPVCCLSKKRAVT